VLLNKHLPAEEIGLVLEVPPRRYEVRLVPSAHDRLFFAEELLGLQLGEGGGWQQVPLGRGHHESQLARLSEMRPGEGWAAHDLLSLLRGCRVYHFHDTSRRAPVKRSGPTADNLLLRYDAGNLAAVLARLKNSQGTADAAAYRRIVGVVGLVAPFFQDFVLESEGGDTVRLRWLERRSETIFSADQMSDGTLRFVCLATLLLSPEIPPLVVLDEPELGLHPSAIVQLAGLLRSASTRSQVLVATQSVTLLNQFEPDDLVVVERADNGSILRRPDSAALAAWIDDYALGELWEKNIIGGRPGRAGGSLA
jgi:predicted ATPase